MGVRVQYFCDGCGRNLDPDQVNMSNTAAASVASGETFRPFVHQIFTETFCQPCLEKSADYWNEKLKVLTDAVEVTTRRLDNFRKGFFSQKTMKVVK